MNRTKWMAGILTSAAVVLAGLGVGTATAGAAPKVDPLLPTELTLPFMGAPLKLTVTTGPGGAIASADLDNAGAFTATDVSARKVSFVANDGTLQLTVRSKGNEQRVTAKAAEFSQLVGTSNWSGDVFGTGLASTVAFTIGGDELAPTLTIDSAVSGDAAAGGEATIGAVRTESDDDDGEIEVKGSVQFTLDGQSRTLYIKVKVETDDDDSAADSPEAASLRITLSKLRGVPQSIEDAVGQKTWTAALCDGTNTATVVYTVNADGTLTLDSATNTDGSSPEIKAESNKIEVRFGKDARVKFRSSLDGDQITVRIEEKVRCRDAADPTTNVSTSTTIDDDDDDDDEDEHHSGGHDDDDDDDDHNGGGRDHDEDD